MGIPAQNLQELLGRHMAACRTLAGLSQQAMAERLNVRQTYVSQLERGQWVNMDPYKLLEYVKVGLDVTAVLREWNERQHDPEAAMVGQTWQHDPTIAEDGAVADHPAGV